MTRVQLADPEWEFIEPYLPIREYGPYPERLRQQFEGVIWRFRTGGQWREIPTELGKMLSIARAEIRRHDWAAIRCGCGLPAPHLLNGLMEDVLTGAPAALHAMDGHAFEASFLKDPAPAVASVALGMLADGLAPKQAEHVLWLMLQLAAGEGGDEDPESSSLYACTFRVLRGGLTLIYREFLNNPWGRQEARELLEILEAEQGKQAFCEEFLRSAS
nr:transposase [Streptomyces vietnamensis]